MLVIRFRRVGKKNKPTYRVVVAEHSWSVNGKFTADLGFYNPHTKTTGLNLDEVKTWLNKGAKPSNSVAKILKNEKVKHNSVVVVKKNKKPRKTAEEAVKAGKPTEETATTEETPENTQAETTEAAEASAETPAAEEPSAEPQDETAETNEEAAA